MRSISAVKRTPSTMALGAAVIVAIASVAQGAPPAAAPPSTAPPAPSAPPSASAPAAPAPTPVTSAAPPPTAVPPAETAPPAPAPAPAPPAPAAAPAPKDPTRQPPKTTAYVHVFASYPKAQLELRSTVDDTGWRAVCLAPCDREVDVDAMEARVTAPGMTSSNVFNIEPGRGTASFKVNGGSASSRQIGLIGLASGIPISLVGMALYGTGSIEESKGLRTAGIATLVVGGVTVLGSLPFLAVGSTRVQDAKGKSVARRWTPPPL